MQLIKNMPQLPRMYNLFIFCVFLLIVLVIFVPWIIQPLASCMLVHFLFDNLIGYGFVSVIQWRTLFHFYHGFYIYLNTFQYDYTILSFTLFSCLKYWLRGIVVPRAGGRAAGQTSPVHTLTSIIFQGSFSNLARTCITLRSRTGLIMKVLPH